MRGCGGWGGSVWGSAGVAALVGILTLVVSLCTCGEAEAHHLCSQVAAGCPISLTAMQHGPPVFVVAKGSLKHWCLHLSQAFP